VDSVVEHNRVPTAALAHAHLASPPSTAGFNIPSLDGIRALSFVVVFVAHAGYGNLIPGGFGVTTFFFLSGFLITSLLRKEFAATQAVSFRKFYARRVLRIFPPMYITLALATLGVYAGLVAGDLTFRAMAVQALQLTNLQAIIDPSSGQHIPGGTDVLWSLAVEEHFYIVFPMVSLLLFRHSKPPRSAAMLMVVCAAVLAWRCVLVLHFHVPTNRTYMGTDTRIDSILFGCALALYHNPYMDRPLRGRAPVEAALFAAAVVLLIFTFVFRGESFRETFRYTLQGVALLPIFYFAVARKDWPVFAWLQWPWVRWIGTASYTMYLSHHVLLYIVEARWPHLPMALRAVIAAAMTLLFAALMYVCVERPCAALRKRLHAENKPAKTPAAAPGD
jgi:peptidoglycan/LPS O-acetylase OafA/YrhL